MKTFIASLVFALLSISLMAQSPVNLKLNLEKGRVYKVKSTSKQAIQQTANGQQYAIDVLSNTVFSFRVLKQENDVMDISFKLDTIASKIWANTLTAFCLCSIRFPLPNATMPVSRQLLS